MFIPFVNIELQNKMPKAPKRAFVGVLIELPNEFLIELVRHSLLSDVGGENDLFSLAGPEKSKHLKLFIPFVKLDLDPW